jgi:hypothetical protein
MRTSGKVILSNGDSFISEINGDEFTFVNYYLGKIFNLGSVGDNMQKCVRIVFDNYEILED